MSSESPAVILAGSGTPQSTPEPEERSPCLSLAQHNENLRAEALRFRLDLDEVNSRLLHSRVCHQSEAQSRQTMQRRLDALQSTHLRTIQTYKSIYAELDLEKAKLQEEKTNLQEEIQLDKVLIARQKELIDLLQTYTQPQQAVCSSQDASMLPQYNDHGNSNHYSTYLPPRHEFIIDSTSLPQLDDLDYGIRPSTEPTCDPNTLMPATVTEYDNQLPAPSVQPTEFPTSAERDTPGPINNGNLNKRVSEDDGAKPHKKRKTK